MATTRRVHWCALLPALLLLASAHDALARPRLTCATIRADETVVSVAKRITGDARNVQAPWFQIVNPTTSRWVPKERYGLRFAGWNACIVDELRPPLAYQPVDVVAASLETSSAPQVFPSQLATRLDSRFVTWEPVVVWCTAVLLLALGCWFVDDYLAERDRVLRTMKRYADKFVREFERPLIQQHLPHRPIESRIRFRPGRSRFDVLLAPQGELRYPNLTDHKRNVMYDVVRIQQALSEHAFVSSRPYAKGRWVVVPFRFRVDPREAGGK